MSAAELRQAAETLRERANAATPAPWRHTDSEVVDDVFDAGLVVVGPERDPIALVCDQWYEDQDGEPTPWHDAAYIATMHPGVGLMLADLLDSLAFRMEQIEDAMPPNASNKFAVSSAQVQGSMQGLRIARLINGGAA